MDDALAKLQDDLEKYRKWHGVFGSPLRFALPLRAMDGSRWQFLVWAEGKLPLRLELKAEDEAKAKQAVLELKDWANQQNPD